jgi:hypothetical protein
MSEVPVIKYPESIEIFIRSQRNVVLVSVSVKSSILSSYDSTALCWTLAAFLVS